MARTHKKVRYSPTGKLEDVTPDMAARGVEGAFRILEGRWKMVIIFHLFARGTLRFSELERAIPGVSQKMLIQQLRELERDGIVRRTVYPQVPPKVEYNLTKWGQAMCPALDSLLEWAGTAAEVLAAQVIKPLTMSALGQKQTFALQNVMSALPPIATAKAKFRKTSCLLYPRKRTCALQQPVSAMGQKQTSGTTSVMSAWAPNKH